MTAWVATSSLLNAVTSTSTPRCFACSTAIRSGNSSIEITSPNAYLILVFACARTSLATPTRAATTRRLTIDRIQCFILCHLLFRDRRLAREYRKPTPGVKVLFFCGVFSFEPVARDAVTSAPGPLANAPCVSLECCLVQDRGEFWPGRASKNGTKA